MKLLKKFGLALFSMMLFCGISATAFASTADVHADAYVDDNNSDIVASMKSRDGEEHSFRIYATYYDHRGRQVGRNKIEDDSLVTSREVTWCNIRDWDRVNVLMFCDGELMKNKDIKRLAFDDNGVYMTCYVDDDNNITAKMNFERKGDTNYKVKLVCKDQNGNEVYSDVNKDTSSGEVTIDWTLIPKNWKSATLQYRIDGELYTLGLTKVNK
ncbi:hypothetical protein Z959_07110 [Clostridium novyi B str. ATCC 27606]|uniref:Uncharacterized protein n=1 Tax=Clostridium novyi B str. ATCC 27606 TaxID=1443123 RepID=A0AA40IW78_CLONO|nr:hypothetical protein [Clostridium novyi]KEI18487.1 hypothetical protein Z959_07110 [Clostridium novyi B str. ATCC 27606]